MTIKLKIKDKAADYVELFYKKVWHQANIDYFGKQIDWSSKTTIIETYDKDELVGVIEMHMQVGVMYIFELAVIYSHQRRGIGRMLMENAEEIAKKEKMHKIYLDTGKNWGTAPFYEKLGFIKTGEFPKHFGGHDYLQYSKFL
ncbi:MAG: GNAT family N-acetyltransferase [Candidatus Levyibacteriota bacterium]